MRFAAIELIQDENPEHAIRRFILVAADLGIKFKTLVSFGPIEFATARFIRFQTDCPDFHPIAMRLKEKLQGIIIPGVAGYRAFLSNGKEGSAGPMLMQTVMRPGYGKKYLGSGHLHWEHQFGPVTS